MASLTVTGLMMKPVRPMCSLLMMKPVRAKITKKANIVIVVVQGLEASKWAWWQGS